MINNTLFGNEIQILDYIDGDYSCSVGNSIYLSRKSFDELKEQYMNSASYSAYDKFTTQVEVNPKPTHLTVGQLKKLIKDLPDDTPVCVPMVDGNSEDAFYARRVFVHHYFDNDGAHTDLCIYADS